MAACFLIFYCFAPDLAAAPLQTPEPVASSGVLPKAQGTQVKSKPKSKPGAKPSAKARTKKKVRAAKPLVSAATKNKAEAITCEISPALPENLESEISKFFGLRYRLGGEGRSGIDCSALIKQVYSEVFGINLPRSSREQSRLGSLDPVDQDELQTGDLLFFGPGRKRVNHVGMYLAGGHFLHAARSEGVTISRLDNGYWKSRYMFSKRARGINGLDEHEEAADLKKALIQDSFSFSLDGADAEESFSLLEAGIRINDSLEFLLSGFFLNALEATDTPPDPDSSVGVQTEAPAEGESGFRLAAIFSPLEWIKLIPSVTQVDDDSTEKKRDDHYQKMGLETWMILPSSRVAVFMAAHARNQEDFFEQPREVSPDWRTMDFALGLHYHLSESLRFSLWGTQALSPDLKPNDDAGRRSGAVVEDVSFQLNIRF
jgi:cell wall-associated NlpC family hydrolase